MIRDYQLRDVKTILVLPQNITFSIFCNFKVEAYRLLKFPQNKLCGNLLADSTRAGCPRITLQGQHHFYGLLDTRS